MIEDVDYQIVTSVNEIDIEWYFIYTKFKNTVKTNLFSEMVISLLSINFIINLLFQILVVHSKLNLKYLLQTLSSPPLLSCLYILVAAVELFTSSINNNRFRVTINRGDKC